MGGMSFAEKAERVLIIAMVFGILVVTLSPRVLWMYQAGLGLLLSSTILQIAVGNLPRDAGFKRSLKYIAIILSLVATAFILGILLVPVLSTLGR